MSVSAILQLEKERALLEQRKIVAYEACIKEERRLEELQSKIVSLDAVLRGRTQEDTFLENRIETNKAICAGIEKEIAVKIQERDQFVLDQDQEVARIQSDTDALRANQKGLQIDIANLQQGLNNIQSELGTTKESLLVKGQELLSLLPVVEEEYHKLNTIRSGQEFEKQSLQKQRSELLTIATQNEKKEQELYTLREDLIIVRDRYAEFARENNLPFNI